MYRAEKWMNGKLYFQHTPDGPWEEASPEQMISWLHETIMDTARLVAGFEERLTALEERVGAMEHQATLTRWAENRRREIDG